MDDSSRGPAGTVLRVTWGEAASHFARDVKEARKKRKMSADALAEQCRLSLGVIADLEQAFPVECQAVAAVSRNLDLNVPDLEADPVYRLGLLLRQCRERARLSRSKLAAVAGIAMLTIKRLERASHWPRAETCTALLSVQALQLEPQDFAAFVDEPAAVSCSHSESPPIGDTQTLPPATEPFGQPADSDAKPGKIARPSPARRTAPPRGSALPRLALTVRIYDDGTLIVRPGQRSRT